MGHRKAAASVCSTAASGRLHGHALDVGCGTGEHALMAADAGCEATGVDISPSAIRLAQAKASKRAISTRFVVADARDLASLGQQFDVVLDCGLFHIFDDEDRGRFVASLASATRPGGAYFMLCFSENEPPGWGPRRITQDEIQRRFRRRVAGRVDRTSGPRCHDPQRTRALVVRVHRAALRDLRPPSSSSRTERKRRRRLRPRTSVERTTGFEPATLTLAR